MIYLGIDPGKQGAIAWRCQITGDHSAVKMPDSPKKLHRLIVNLKSDYGVLCVCIEEVQVMGRVFGAKAALSYGRGYGEIIGILTAEGAIIHEVRPSVWKKGMNVNADKNTSILLCERLFPELELIPPGCRKPQDGIAEAALLVAYAEKMGLK